jgi:hypothetical protein
MALKGLEPTPESKLGPNSKLRALKRGYIKIQALNRAYIKIQALNRAFTANFRR